MIKVHILHCGQVRVDSSLPFHENSINPLAYTGLFRSKKHQVWLPVSVYLIEHPKGLVLIDTGWNSDVRSHQKEHLGFLQYSVSRALLPDGDAINEQLEKLGYKTSDIDYLVLSHMHADHVSGIKLVKDAKKILVSDLEWKETQDRSMRYVKSMWKGIDFELFSFNKTGIGPEGLSYDLFDDGTVVFVSTPGHTMGLASTIIKNKENFVLLASDVGYAKKSWEQMILPGVQVDKHRVANSLKWVKSESEKPTCIEAIANHDPEMKPHVIEL
ncbi:N-acyl homoserine lactonase family protein [Chryseobacterium lathyri]|uniref:N-acyl homoserine lactonase family protein n=1 Tax=Chryseobacterium lathyri TaxID=395933 RepID=UPI002786CBEF|nr:N-acyl homoserine lactonase family protein [Chryseobacterium lathyri]MDQ0066633.1 glyoxylase-like metal-dependent hydrolase (beta-lactamase superfamily II) [Chryseobacterium lathyri]